MTLLVLLLGGGILFWATKAGRLPALRFADVVAAVVAVIGVGLVRKGLPVPGAMALAGAGFWAWRRWRGGAAGAGRGMGDVADARALLDLPAHADAEMIRTAHRRLIARVHPDSGGSTELARRVNQARDVLLARASDPDGARRNRSDIHRPDIR